MKDYQRIARSIDYIIDRADEQPSLAELAARVHLSPYHYQRLFRRWAGITPKQFLQVVTTERGKNLLEGPGSLLEVSGRLGLSSVSRLHDHFVTLEAATPGSFRNGGAGLTISHGICSSPFGDFFIARTDRGLCRAAFVDDDGKAELNQLRQLWPRAVHVEDNPGVRETGERIFGQPPESAMGIRDRPLRIAVRGTNFQISVWRALLKIPPGQEVSYSQLADYLGAKRSARAVANAVAANPVAYLIPCHRVIRASGALGGYRWGSERKRVIQLWEKGRRIAEVPASGC